MSVYGEGEVGISRDAPQFMGGTDPHRVEGGLPAFEGHPMSPKGTITAPPKPEKFTVKGDPNPHTSTADAGAYKRGLDASEPVTAQQSADKAKYEDQLGGEPISSVTPVGGPDIAATFAARMGAKSPSANMAPGPLNP
jgi:hypothetical protein